MAAIKVAIAAFDGIRPFHLSVPCAVFGEPAGAEPLYEVRVCAVEPGELRSQAGFTIGTGYGLRELERAQDAARIPLGSSLRNLPVPSLSK